MKTSRILLGFTKLAAANLESQATAVHTAMTGNANFLEPQPSLEVFGAAIKNFTEAMADAHTRHMVSVAAKKGVRDALVLVMRKLVTYVEYIAQGDRVIQVSSGFPVNSLTKTLVQLATPANFSVELGRNSGEVVVSVNSVDGARSYSYFYAPAPVQENQWTQINDTPCSFVITGLEPGKPYSFRMGATGPRGQKVYTDIITRLVV